MLVCKSWSKILLRNQKLLSFLFDSILKIPNHKLLYKIFFSYCGVAYKNNKLQLSWLIKINHPNVDNYIPQEITENNYKDMILALYQSIKSKNNRLTTLFFNKLLRWLVYEDFKKIISIASKRGMKDIIFNVLDIVQSNIMDSFRIKKKMVKNSMVYGHFDIVIKFIKRIKVGIYDQNFEMDILRYILNLAIYYDKLKIIRMIREDLNIEIENIRYYKLNNLYTSLMLCVKNNAIFTAKYYMKNNILFNKKDDYYKAINIAINNESPKMIKNLFRYHKSLKFKIDAYQLILNSLNFNSKIIKVLLKYIKINGELFRYTLRACIHSKKKEHMKYLIEEIKINDIDKIIKIIDDIRICFDPENKFMIYASNLLEKKINQ